VLSLSRGIAIGPVAFWQNERLRPLRIHLTQLQIEDEILRLRKAGDEALRQIEELTVSANAPNSEPVAGIMDVHRAIIEESSFIDKIEAVIRSERVNAEWALRKISAEYIQRQASAADEALQEKHIDIADVTDRLQRALAGSRLTTTEPGAVIVAESLRPSTVVELAKRSPGAIVTDRAGWTSHTSILARELRLPMVSGVSDLAEIFQYGETVVVDADLGEIIVDPSDETLGIYADQSLGHSARVAEETMPAGIATRDGTAIVLKANSDSPESYQQAYRFGARGIGLFRSESLIKGPDQFPSEDEQVRAYAALADAAGPDGIKIRTFDIESGDAGGHQISPERNPALGLRSLRLSLFDETLFRGQIRAILRAAAGRAVGIVLPMISGIGEFRRCKELVAIEKGQFEEAGVLTGEPSIGAMIEIPSAVMTVRTIAAEADFLCLGTNDLVQYLLAVDRDNDSVAEWYQTLHPAVLSSLEQVLSAGAEMVKIVTVCGEMAGSPFYVPLLLGLGARELSMNVNSIHRVRRLVSGISLEECKQLADDVSNMTTAADTEEYLRAFYRQHWSDLFPTGLLDARHR
jgi:phosphotransferase system enzyme I (PtsI)